MPSQINPERNLLENELRAASQELNAALGEPTKQFWEVVEGQTKELLSRCIAAGEDAAADKAWFLHKVAESRLKFVVCFEQLKKEQYYRAWCDLERVEIDLDWLKNNPFYDVSTYQVEEFKKLISAWQSLFPYHVFCSPEFLIGREECSICGGSADPWSDCWHRKGFVYGGRECIRLVRNVELLSVSLVRNPVQKYSVPFTQDAHGKQIDQYDYSIVKFVAERVASPFDRWSAHWTEAYHPHEMFNHIGPGDACPCESGRRYDDCCLLRRGVVRPHLQILFDKHPPHNLPNTVFAGYDKRNGPAKLSRISPDDGA
jgi:SEC-C motif